MIYPLPLPAALPIEESAPPVEDVAWRRGGGPPAARRGQNCRCVGVERYGSQLARLRPKQEVQSRPVLQVGLLRIDKLCRAHMVSGNLQKLLKPLGPRRLRQTLLRQSQKRAAHHSSAKTNWADHVAHLRLLFGVLMV